MSYINTTAVTKNSEYKSCNFMYSIAPETIQSIKLKLMVPNFMQTKLKWQSMLYRQAGRQGSQLGNCLIRQITSDKLCECSYLKPSSVLLKKSSNYQTFLIWCQSFSIIFHDSQIKILCAAYSKNDVRFYHMKGPLGSKLWMIPFHSLVLPPGHHFTLSTGLSFPLTPFATPFSPTSSVAASTHYLPSFPQHSAFAISQG